MDDMLAKEGNEKKESEDIHWIARARYHVRMEDYWRDRAKAAELELEQVKHELRQLKNSRRPKKSSKNFEEDMNKNFEEERLNISRCCD